MVSPDLAALARACGVAVEFSSWNGTPTESSPEAIRAALSAMGVDASTDEACRASLEALEDAVWTRIVPPSTVIRAGREHAVNVHVVDGEPASVMLHLEDGGTWELDQVDNFDAPRDVGGVRYGRAAFRIPPHTPLGWHRIEVSTTGRRGRGYVIVTPERVELPEKVASSRPWGIAAQLYSVRSSRSWGLGDYGDLAELVSLSKVRAGADFVQINPVHACEPTSPLEDSPYLPTSRRFHSPLYIRVEDIPEVAYLPSQQRALLEWSAEPARRLNESGSLLQRDAVWKAKSEALRQVYAAPRSPGREAQFEAYCIDQGPGLEDFATWCALTEAFDGEAWPEEFHHPRSRAVVEWREQHAEEILYFAWLQWVADEQLARAAEVADAVGMSVGVMADLAVGVHPDGADAWANSRVLASGISVGAPPDMYNQKGQDWSQPPWQPRALEQVAYLPFRDLLRNVMRHAGAVRIDHILGLFRLWWIRNGASPADGAYVSFDHEALIGILALEAHRSGTVIIGEDLGTLPDGVTDYLNSRGILGTQVVWFEKEDGRPKAPESFRRDVLVSVTVHDLPPNAAYLAGEHVTLREELGLLDDPEEVRAEAARERESVIEALTSRGIVPEGADDETLIAGLNQYALYTPAALMAVTLTDATGDRRAQNMPGTHKEYPNWRVPLCDGEGQAVMLDDLFDTPRAQRLFAAVREARG